MTQAPAPPDQGIRIRTEVAKPGTGKPWAGAAIEMKDVNLSYGTNHVLHDITMDVGEKMVTAFIGPSGCGKSTLLRCLNRMNDLIDRSEERRVGKEWRCWWASTPRQCRRWCRRE